jgi:hypothetical protein
MDSILVWKRYCRIHSSVKATIELPEELLERTRIAAERRQTSVGELVIEGLEIILGKEGSAGSTAGALTRLNQGYHLGGQPITRDQAHER